MKKTTPSLFPDLDGRAHPSPRVLARREDPATSQAAAAEAVYSGLLSAHEAKILAALACFGGAGATKDELAQATGLDSVAVARRMARLRDEGLVESAGFRALPSGRHGTAWRVTGKGARSA